MQTLRSSLSSVIYHSRRSLGQKDKGVRILCYHSVDDQNQDYTAISPAHFEAQINFLFQEGYKTIHLQDLLNAETNGGPTVQSSNAKDSEKTVVITFDDGFQDNYENVYPILRRFGFKATIFLIGERIGRDGYLKKQEILELHQNGFQFGSHTLTHPDLRHLSSAEKRKEISDSKKFLERELGFDVDFFCYPSGFFDETVVRVVKEAGYQGACSNMPGSNSKIHNPYLLKRTEIAAHDTLNDFRKKLAGGYDLLHLALHRLRGRP